MRRWRHAGRKYLFGIAVIWLACEAGVGRAEDAPLAGTAPLTMKGDIASTMIDGIDKFLLCEIDQSIDRRPRHWKRDLTSAEAYQKSIQPNRERLARILGIRDATATPDGLELAGTTRRPALVATGSNYEVYAVRWPAIQGADARGFDGGGIDGEGLWLKPTGGKPRASVVCIPDAAQTPEVLVGLEPGLPPDMQFARRLAESGCEVVVPMLIDRGTDLSATMNGQRKTKITHREFLYRPAFELGRHLVGFELQKVLAAVNWLAGERLAADAAAGGAFLAPTSTKIGVVGYGEGGMLALYAGALEPKIDVVGVSGHFASRQNIWQEPLDRNVFRLLREFGDAELASMIAPRRLVVEACGVPAVVIPPGTGGGPGRLETPELPEVVREVARAKAFVEGLTSEPWVTMVVGGDGAGDFGTAGFLEQLVGGLGIDSAAGDGGPPKPVTGYDVSPDAIAAHRAARLKRQFDQIERFTQRLVWESSYIRAEFMAKADRASRDVDKYVASVQPYRDYFRNEVVGRFDYDLAPPRPRSRRILDTPKYTGYEVVLDVFPDVFAYGIYIVPKGMKPGEKRPVVVCQHGLEGRPQDVIGEKGAEYYSAFATKLAERGYITFAPQNIYIFKDRFRTLQRKANAVGCTLFSIMVPQHEQIVAWLGSRGEVDAKKIAFYGLSYGGKSAMRIPALVDGYCLSICSADFNEWIWKNASTRSQYTYVATGEYEIFEFDLGQTFNYAEMAALICPRPFMVERGHRDGVAPDEMVAHEFAKVRLLYTDLKIADRAELEFFDGPHSIHGVGTFEFLDKHLRK